MINDKTRELIEMRDWDSLSRHFDSMSNMEFRRTESFIRERVLPQLDNEGFWETLLHIIIYKRTAFLACAAGVGNIAASGMLSFNSEHARALSAHLAATNSESLVKIVCIMLPHMKTREQTEGLLQCFLHGDYKAYAAVLLRFDTPLCYFLLFRSLCHLSEDKRLIANCCRHIMRRGSDTAYNMASLLVAYHGITELNTRFSLNIEPYELSFIDKNYDTFMRVLQGKRPVL